MDDDENGVTKLNKWIGGFNHALHSHSHSHSHTIGKEKTVTHTHSLICPI